MQPLALEDVAELLDARLVLDGRVGVGSSRPGLVGILAALAVHVEQLFGFGVERLKGVVAKRPSRGDAVLVADLAEIRLAQAEQGGAVDF